MTMLACQSNSQLRQLSTELLACTPHPETGFLVELADTILYPEGGGQPADHGQIEEACVVDVQRAPDGRVLHHVDRALEAGPVQVHVDWLRRFDHMQQHTGQHLLTAITQDQLGLATTSFHLGATRSHIELDGPPMNHQALLELEEEVNRHIAAALPIQHHLALPEELEARGVRTRGLPAGHQGSVRLVEIAGLDLNTCGGTHVENTAALGVIHLLSCERYKSASRLHFLVGGRVRSALRLSWDREQQLNRLLQGGAEAHIELVEKLQARDKSSARALKKIRTELAAAQGHALAGSPGALVHHHQEDGDMNHLRALAQAALGPADERVLFLTASDGTGQGVFLLAGEPQGVARLGPIAADAMEGRGGGSGGRFQGKGAQVQVTKELLEQMLQALQQS
jgi:Ser-tRNA(Ala) deacylase AlaX